MIRPLTLPMMLATCLLACGAFAQDRLVTMPRYEQYSRLRDQIPGSVTGGDIEVSWTADGRSFKFFKAGKYFQYDVKTRRTTDFHEEEAVEPVPTQNQRQRPRARPGRG